MDEFVLGTDPEVAIVLKKTNTIRSPHDIVYDPMVDRLRGRQGAIGVDGDRGTSPIEFRPGTSPSAEVLVDRMADLFNMLLNHYHPKGVAYRAGAWVSPEPLGFHIHLGWKAKSDPGEFSYGVMLFRTQEILRGWQAMADYLVPRLFDKDEVANRVNYAVEHRRDFAKPLAFRPEGGLPQVMKDRHIEFRYLPSCMQTPEAAYSALGGAELIVKEVFSSDKMVERDWPAFVGRMYTEHEAGGQGFLSLKGALDVAMKYVYVNDIADTWRA